MPKPRPVPEKERPPSKAVVISNGFGKFPLAIAAAEAARRGMLSRFITGFYPMGWLERLIAAPVLREMSRLQRLAARREEIPTARIQSHWAAELLFIVAFALAKRTRTQPEAAFLVRLSHRLYGRAARNTVRRASGASLYHYRSGYGFASVEVAKDAGMLLLCHHSIGHPAVLSSLVEDAGKLPEAGKERPINTFWKAVLWDTERADHILTNSEFARSTFLHQGWDPSRVHVIYFGVDDAFFEAIPPPPPLSDKALRESDARPVKLAFAGRFSKRKGAEVLIEALARLGEANWELEIVGAIDGGFASRFPAFFRDPRVYCLGLVSREVVAARLAEADVFVFPSLVEGSARVVFEAMACRCYVITTSNSGSIVEDGIHGRLVEPGDADSLAVAIEEACSQPAKLIGIGAENSDLIRRSYRQADLGQRLESLYRGLLQCSGNAHDG